MRVFDISSNTVQESDTLPVALPEAGMVWISCSRDEFRSRLPELQAALQRRAACRSSTCM